MASSRPQNAASEPRSRMPTNRVPLTISQADGWPHLRTWSRSGLWRREVPRRANDVQPTEPIRYGTYVCLAVPPGPRRAAADLPVLASRLALRSEFDPGADHPPNAISFLRGTV